MNQNGRRTTAGMVLDVDIAAVCRLCFNKRDEMTNLFGERAADQQSTSLASQLNNVASVEVRNASIQPVDCGGRRLNSKKPNHRHTQSRHGRERL